MSTLIACAGSLLLGIWLGYNAGWNDGQIAATFPTPPPARIIGTKRKD